MVWHSYNFNKFTPLSGVEHVTQKALQHPREGEREMEIERAKIRGSCCFGGTILIYRSYAKVMGKSTSSPTIIR